MNTTPADAAGPRTTTVLGSGGTRLNVHLAGPDDGVPVLLLHGQGSSGRIWNQVMRGPLAETARMIAPDYRGHGRSDRPLRGYHDSRTWAGDVTAIVDHFELHNPVLIGWSYGTAVACDYLRHDGRARAFALVAGGTEAGILDNEIRATLAPPLRDLLRRRVMPSGPRGEAFASEFTALFTEQPQSKETRALLIDDAGKISLPAALGVATRRYHNDDILSELDIAIVQIHGAEDRIRLPSAAERRAPLFRRGRTEIWADTGHAPFLDQPDRFNAAVEGMLSA